MTENTDDQTSTSEKLSLFITSKLDAIVSMERDISTDLTNVRDLLEIVPEEYRFASEKEVQELRKVMEKYDNKLETSDDQLTYLKKRQLANLALFIWTLFLIAHPNLGWMTSGWAYLVYVSIYVGLFALTEPVTAQNAEEEDEDDWEESMTSEEMKSWQRAILLACTHESGILTEVYRHSRMLWVQSLFVDTILITYFLIRTAACFFVSIPHRNLWIHAEGSAFYVLCAVFFLFVVHNPLAKGLAGKMHRICNYFLMLGVMDNSL
ncbi:hypothetical protein CAEBREN_07080 [Caenorhabditis brenneri]|uniref:Uncharacterized protein n=1 Tax=Caenorhabditis brenneri TaxID=135651 RepID=G0MBX0_CAEBE|nr:hypothetical protein CAEBREN_07080 [Caenorhabditis brenneri]